ncbi:MAG: selenium cofactor biosynthesis protein YqeC [bacterium]
MDGQFIQSIQFIQPWHQILPRDGGHILSFAGGGGKTSLLATVAAQYCQLGVPVIATTTTRTEPLAWPGLEIWDQARLEQPPDWTTTGLLYIHDGTHADGKWRGLRPEVVDDLHRLWPEAVVLVEVDGSGGFPVKLHRENEPVWPGRTALVFWVLGLTAIDGTVAEVLFRQERLPVPWTQTLDPEDSWSWRHTMQLLTGPGGYLSRQPAGLPAYLAVCQLDSLEDSLGLLEFTGQVLQETRIPLVLLCELARETPHLQVVCLEETPEDLYGSG